ncbi:MAG: glutamate--tRNA ligase [Patescibacteria group bacterium]
MDSVRVRFAPSPTGRMHIGNFRSALYNYLFARKHGGVFFVRIEDTDRSRLVDNGVENILRTLASMGISYEEGPFLNEDGSVVQRGSMGPYVQSERLEIYRARIEQLLENGDAYPCFCTPERLDALRTEQEAMKKPTGYDRRCRTLSADETRSRIISGERHVVRAKMPDEGETEFHDAVRGPVKFRHDLLDDYVLLKGDGYPTYHLANVIDDHMMETTHVIRGEEWLSSTPKHLLLYKAFGWTPPQFAHMPLLLNPDRSKLSKRQGDVAVEDYLANGYLPEALINFVALLGWNPSDEKEIYELRELIDAFELKDINSAGAVFNREKLDWLNGKYLRMMPIERLAERAAPFLERAGLVTKESDGWRVARGGEKLTIEDIGRIVSLERERVKTLAELPEAVSFLLEDVLEYPAESLRWKGQPIGEALARLDALLEVVGAMDEADFTPKDAEERVKSLITGNGWGNGDTLWPLRVALSGREKSPGPFEIMSVLGKMKVIRRLEAAKNRLNA